MNRNIQGLKRDQDTQELVLTSLGGTEHSESFLLRPEEASYLQYTITPPTMLIGYQVDESLSDYQIIFKKLTTCALIHRAQTFCRCSNPFTHFACLYSRVSGLNIHRSQY